MRGESLIRSSSMAQSAAPDLNCPPKKEISKAEIQKLTYKITAKG
jgi:hypothetical protein